MNDVVSKVRQERSKRTAEAIRDKRLLSELQIQAKFSSDLLNFEDDVRQITDERELAAHLCNSTREVINFHQAFYGEVRYGTNTFRLIQISSIPAVDRDAPFTHWFERTINQMIAETGGKRQLSFMLDRFSEANEEELKTYPFPEFLWTPQINNDQLVGGFLVARDTPWLEMECSLVRRLSHLYLHAKTALQVKPPGFKRTIATKPVLCLGLLALVATCFLPVSITALAPVEVTPEDPFILSAPFDGVIKEIVPQQGDQLLSGDAAIIFDDVHLLNSKQLADQRMEVARARYDLTRQGAIADYRVKRDIEVARTEFELAKSESDYATQLLEQSRLMSPIDGVAIFTDKQDWEGKPVSAGEAILSVANSDKINFAIDLPVSDSIVLEEGARVKVFLDSDPLNPLEATLIEANYGASADKRDVLSYKLKAKLIDDDIPVPRIGVQGTAQVFGEKATLGYTILRRPYSAFRQITGW